MVEKYRGGIAQRFEIKNLCYEKGNDVMN